MTSLSLTSQQPILATPGATSAQARLKISSRNDDETDMSLNSPYVANEHGPVSSGIMQSRIRALVSHARSEKGRRKVRFLSVSATAVLVSLVVLGFCYSVLGWDGKYSILSQIASFVTSTVASFLLNRRWVFQKSGRSDFMKEVAPFWSLAIAQFLISIPFFQWGRSAVEARVDAKLVRLALILALNVSIYGVMLIGKFLFFDRVLFADRKPAS